MRRTSLIRFFLCLIATVFLCLVVVGVKPAFAQQYNPSLYSGMRWRCIGPYRGGRAVATTGVPGHPNLFYMGSVDGGVWKSDDYGHTWKNIFEHEPVSAIGAIAVAPSDPETIYVGTGEGAQRPDLTIGAGMFKSTNGGKTWRYIGLRRTEAIGAIIVDPHNPDRVFVAALGHPYGANPQRGIYRTTDGGRTWKKVLYKNEDTGANDLAFDPKNPQIVYAVLWKTRRPPWTAGAQPQPPGSGLFKSTDGGNTWHQLTSGLPSGVEGLRRMTIGIAPSDPNRIYAVVDGPPQVGGIYRSNDAGEHWQRMNGAPRLWGRGDDFAGFGAVRVDPRNENELYVANTSVYRSTDGGHHFVAIEGAPTGMDFHGLWINPNNPNIIMVGGDQGVTISVNHGQTWSSWKNQPTGQMYHVITDNRFPYWVYGAEQDSGALAVNSRSNLGQITIRDWHKVGADEHAYVAPDPLNPNIVYGGNNVVRFNWVTDQSQEVGPVALRTGKYRMSRTEPLVFSPADPHSLYLAANVLFKTTNGGHSWQIISPDLTRPNPGIPPNMGTFAAYVHRKHRGVIFAVAPSPLDANLIWAGTDDGLIWVTHDGGKHWENVTPPGLTPWSKVSIIEASHFDPNTAYAAINRFRLDDLHPYIYRTHDGGKTWQKITTGLPDDEPVNVVREDPVRKDMLFAGTELGVYVSFDDGDHWQSLQLNLPHTSMRDLCIHGDDLIVATHGRGFWILDDLTPLRQIDPTVASSSDYLYRPAVAYRIRRDPTGPSPPQKEEPAGQNPPTGAIIDYYLRSPASGPVTLSIYDHVGALVRRYSSTDTAEQKLVEMAKKLPVPTYWIMPPQVVPTGAGMHRFVWDLHYPRPKALHYDFTSGSLPHDSPLYPLGPRALPGKYTVKLTVDGHSYSQPLTVKMDPRVKTPLAGLTKQFELERRIAAAMGRDYDTLQQIQKWREGLKQRGRSAELGRRAEAIAGPVPQFNPYGYVGGGSAPNNLRVLNGQLRSLYMIVDSGDGTPTTQAMAAFAELQGRLQALLSRWNRLRSQ